MSVNGKKYREAKKAVDGAKAHSPQEAVGLAKKTGYAKFDETVEVHLTTACDPKKADQLVRGTTVLPHGLGKQVRVLVFAQGDGARKAEEAGADHVGLDDLVKRIQDGWVEFDVAIATPDVMSKIGRLGPVLGRRGLMPNPKSGTVVQPDDVPRAIKEARMGRVEFKLDRTGVIHVPIGKRSFDETKLLDNLAVLMSGIVRARPSGVKGSFIKNITVKTTMGPGIRLDTAAAMDLKPE
ncbi:MAG: 50S ribosomal protein L1 [Chloroflexi bacterium]|nr:50S ribosomal protein L1 [Chloroflexota bacterium]